MCMKDAMSITLYDGTVRFTHEEFDEFVRLDSQKMPVEFIVNAYDRLAFKRNDYEKFGINYARFYAQLKRVISNAIKVVNAFLWAPALFSSRISLNKLYDASVFS